MAASALVAYAAHRLIAADTLSDTADLALAVGPLAAILIAIVVDLRLAPAGPSRTLRAAVPCALTIVGAVFVAASYADVTVAAHSLMNAADADATTTVIALGPRGDDVRLAGEIREGAAAQLGALLDAHPAVIRIALTSEGGLADEGEALRQVIAAHGLTTYVPDFCDSACTLAFVGGRARIVMQGARLGFHAPFEEGLFGQTFAGDRSSVRAAYIEAGVDAGFVKEALGTRPDDMWYPQAVRLQAAHVVTDVVERDRLPDSNLDADPTPGGARATVLRNVPLLAGLDTAAPEIVQGIADWYLARYRQGWSEARVVDGLHELSDDAVALTSAGADDPALVALARFLARAMALTDDEDDCRAIGAGGDLVTAVNAFDGVDPNAAGTAAALLRAAWQGQREAAMPALQNVTPVALGGRQPESCVILRRAYQRALGRPVREAAGLLRPRFAQWARRSAPSLLVPAVTSALPAPHS